MDFHQQSLYKQSKVKMEGRQNKNRLEGYSKRFVIGACDGTRTCDLLITNELHYQLCYTSILNFEFCKGAARLSLYNQSETCSLSVRNKSHCFAFALIAPYFFPSQTHFICHRQRSSAQQIRCTVVTLLSVCDLLIVGQKFIAMYILIKQSQ